MESGTAEAVREKKLTIDGMDAPIECLFMEHGSVSEDIMPKPHYHDYIEFLCATSEECDVDVWVAGELVNMRSGDVLIINPNVAHSFLSRRGYAGYICIKALPEVLYSSELLIAPFLRSTSESYRFYHSSAPSGSELSGIFSEMLEEWKIKRFGYEVALRSLLLRIFLWCVRQSEGEDSSELWGSVGYENAKLIQRSINYINNNYFDVDESRAAASVNMSYSYYSRIFRSVVGKSFKEYVNSVRINHAERLLVSTDMTVTEIAHSTGYATSSHFIENFRRQKGKTPKQYRDTWRKIQ